jgi:hypothetical protein
MATAAPPEAEETSLDQFPSTFESCDNLIASVRGLSPERAQHQVWSWIMEHGHDVFLDADNVGALLEAFPLESWSFQLLHFFFSITTTKIPHHVAEHPQFREALKQKAFRTKFARALLMASVRFGAIWTWGSTFLDWRDTREILEEYNVWTDHRGPEAGKRAKYPDYIWNAMCAVSPANIIISVLRHARLLDLEECEGSNLFHLALLALRGFRVDVFHAIMDDIPYEVAAAGLQKAASQWSLAHALFHPPRRATGLETLVRTHGIEMFFKPVLRIVRKYELPIRDAYRSLITKRCGTRYLLTLNTDMEFKIPALLRCMEEEFPEEEFSTLEDILIEAKHESPQNFFANLRRYHAFGVAYLLAKPGAAEGMIQFLLLAVAEGEDGIVDWLIAFRHWKLYLTEETSRLVFPKETRDQVRTALRNIYMALKSVQ